MRNSASTCPGCGGACESLRRLRRNRRRRQWLSPAMVCQPHRQILSATCENSGRKRSNPASSTTRSRLTKNSFDRLRGNADDKPRDKWKWDRGIGSPGFAGQRRCRQELCLRVLSDKISVSVHCLDFRQKSAYLTLVSQSATVYVDESKAQTTRRTTGLRHARP